MRILTFFNHYSNIFKCKHVLLAINLIFALFIEATCYTSLLLHLMHKVKYSLNVLLTVIMARKARGFLGKLYDFLFMILALEIDTQSFQVHILDLAFWKKRGEGGKVKVLHIASNQSHFSYIILHLIYFYFLHFIYIRLV